MRKHLFLLVLLSASCLFALTQAPPQIRTATYLNNLTLFRDVLRDLNYPKAKAADLKADGADISDSFPGSKPIMKLVGSVFCFLL